MGNCFNLSRSPPISLVTKDGSINKAHVNLTPRSEAEILSSPNLKAFAYNELKNATRNFRPSSVLREGGFGSVFKGWIDTEGPETGPGMDVAVKLLKPGGFQGYKEWLTEVKFLGPLHHPNLVKLFGFCIDGEKMLLVYEFMPKRSLEDHLFRRCPQPPLSWERRIKVAIGAARGLSFLHDASVIFRDFKTSNILLDEEFNSKLSDFGLVREGPCDDASHVSTQVMGTEGYAAPEYVATGHLSTRCDVYSFGVVLIELLSGRPSIQRSKPGIERLLVDWARPCLGNKRKISRIMDARLEAQYPPKEAMTVSYLALKCINSNPKARPTMPAALEVLENLTEAQSTRVVPITCLQCLQL